MAELSGPIGPGWGARHDVALVQALLAQLVDDDSVSYWPGAIDGLADDALTEAIIRFQERHALLADGSEEIAGMVTPRGWTFAAMTAAQSAPFRRLLAVPGSAVVYLPARGGARLAKLVARGIETGGRVRDAAMRRLLGRLALEIERGRNLVIRYPEVAEGPDGQRVRVCFHGLRWIAVSGRLASTEVPGCAVPEPLWRCLAGVVRTLPGLAVEGGPGRLLLRRDRPLRGEPRVPHGMPSPIPPGGAPESAAPYFGGSR